MLKCLFSPPASGLFLKTDSFLPDLLCRLQCCIAFQKGKEVKIQHSHFVPKFPLSQQSSLHRIAYEMQVHLGGMLFLPAALAAAASMTPRAWTQQELP